MNINQPSEQRIQNKFTRQPGSIWDRLTEPATTIRDMGLRRKVRLVSSLLLVIIISVLINWLIDTDIPVFVVIILMAAYGLSRTQYYNLAIILTITLLSIPSFSQVVTETQHTAASLISHLIWLALPLLLSSLLFSLRGSILTAILNLVAILLLPLLIPGLPFQLLIVPLSFIGTLAFLVIVITHQRDLLEQERQAELEKYHNRLEGMVAERTIELRTTNEQLRQEIIERQEIEQELRQSQERLLLAIAGTGGALWDQDLDPEAAFDDQPDDMYLSPWEKKLLGYEKDELAHSMVAWDHHVLPADRSQRDKKQRDHFAGLTEYLDHEYRVRCKDGSIRWIYGRSRIMRNEQGAPIRWIGIDWDVTQRKQAEAQIRLQATALEAAANGIAITDHDGIIVWTNPAFTGITGYTAAEAFGQNLSLLKSGEQNPAFYKELWETIMAGQVWQGDLVNRHKDGSHYSELQTITPVRDADGQISHFVAIKQDITDWVQAKEALRQSEERYALAARGANDGLWDWNLESNTFYYSPRWKAMLGYAENEIGHTPDEWFKRVHPDDLKSLQSAIQSHLQQQSSHFEYEYRLLHQDTTYRWMLCRGLAVYNSAGRAYRMAGSQTDISRRKTAEAQLQHDAMHDALTGLPNRVLFMDRLQRALGHAQRRQNYLFAALFLDLDRFKVINDSLGHLVGDRLLITMAHRLETCVRPGDTVARLGGDEFVILLDDIAGVEEAMQIAGRLQKKITAPLNLSGQSLVITASIGITLGGDSRPGRLYSRPEELLRDADTAMYQAKTQGRARTELFELEMRTRAMARLALETRLRQAIEQRTLQIYYQPIVSLTSGQITHVEALARWQDPQQGCVPPAEFIPLAEDTGLIVPLEEWALRTVCAQLKVWRAAGFTSLRGTVNISPRHFQERNLPALIGAILAETGLAAEALELEITESIVMQNINLNAKMLETLNAMGIQLLIDDFGTGYSSLARLKHLPLQTLKIDHSFAQGLTTNTNDAAITKAIIAMAHSLNLKVIAEGVETEEQLAFLKRHGCDEMQGHLFSRALSSEKLTELLHEVSLGKRNE